MVCIEMHSSRQAEGREWRGRDWSGVEGRGGKGRAGQGRVPDCLGGLSRVGISSRSTRPWNGQPPSSILYYDIDTINIDCNDNKKCDEHSKIINQETENIREYHCTQAL